METRQGFGTGGKNYCSTTSNIEPSAPSRPSASIVSVKPERIVSKRRGTLQPSTGMERGSRRSISTSPHSSRFNMSVSQTHPNYLSRLDQIPVPRRQTLTAGESRVIDDMFSTIFNAAQQQEEVPNVHEIEETRCSTVLSKWISTIPTRQQWSKKGEETLDLKKEEIELCHSDHALFTWTVKELFDSPSLHPASYTTSQTDSSEDIAENTKLPAYAYPHLLSKVMRVMRTRYENPHLALALFEHARHASTVSYVVCCGTAAYNELIEMKWASFRDLQGVCEAVEEMKLNQVRIDSRTTRLVDNIRREVGEQNFWQEEGFGESHSNVLALLDRIDTACWSGVSSRATLQREIVHKPKSDWLADTEAWKLPTKDGGDYLEFV